MTQQGFPQIGAPLVDANGRITTAWFQLLISLWNRNGTITGEVIAYAATDVPDGWLLCNGDAVNRKTFSTLFAVIGTAFGAGDGVSTFNLPNLGGNVVLGANALFPPGSSGNIAAQGSTVQYTALNYLIKT